MTKISLEIRSQSAVDNKKNNKELIQGQPLGVDSWSRLVRMKATH